MINGPGGTLTTASEVPKSPISEYRGAKCGALSVVSSRSDPQLQRLIDAWATLNKAAREQIGQIIENAGSRDATVVDQD